MNCCRVISRYGIGTDRIDVETATRMGIVVTNVPTFCNDEMGDHAMALLLSLARQLFRMSALFHKGSWRSAHRIAERNHRLTGQVLGLVGLGNSAKALARRANAFGMRILATRRNMNAADPDVERLGITLVDLDTLVRDSDYVSLHAPLTPQTYHLFDTHRIFMMKPGAVLINTSRGALVDEDALVAALREGRLGGAGLDTFEQIDPFSAQEAPPKHALLELDNVVVTPHVAASSVEAARDVISGGVENLLSVLSGYWPFPERIVNRGVLPRWSLASHEPSAFHNPSNCGGGS
jgi:D-3-phosphoglycerate dehydrogenase